MITGLALLSLAAGCLMLGELSRRRTDQPQDWALIAALCFGVTGALLVIVRPERPHCSPARLGLANPSRRADRLDVPGIPPITAQLVTTRRPLSVASASFPGRAWAASSRPSWRRRRATSLRRAARTYLVAGHRLYLRCTGAGSPVVVLFNGLGERTPSWTWVQGDVEAPDPGLCLRSRRRRMERSGRQADRTPINSPHDVHGLLAAANVPGPYILAGHSVGGAYALAYAMDYRGTVASVALLDSTTPYQFDLSMVSDLLLRSTARVRTVAPLARAGVVRAYIELDGQSAAGGCPKPSANVRIFTARTGRGSGGVRRATNCPSPGQGSDESRW